MGSSKHLTSRCALERMGISTVWLRGLLLGHEAPILCLLRVYPAPFIRMANICISHALRENRSIGAPVMGVRGCFLLSISCGYNPLVL